MYKDESGRLKGDARIGYVKPESVELAIQMMDNSEFSPGHQITVK